MQAALKLGLQQHINFRTCEKPTITFMLNATLSKTHFQSKQYHYNAIVFLPLTQGTLYLLPFNKYFFPFTYFAVVHKMLKYLMRRVFLQLSYTSPPSCYSQQTD